jgi:hypothetical protein
MPAQDIKAPQPSLSDAINMLMANPQIISTVASALGNVSPKNGEKTDTERSGNEHSKEDFAEPPKTADAPAPDLSALVSTISPLISGAAPHRSSGGRQHESEAERREALLCALKPYVSEGRRDAIDYIIRISRMSDILKNFQQQE